MECTPTYSVKSAQRYELSIISIPSVLSAEKYPYHIIQKVIMSSKKSNPTHSVLSAQSDALSIISILSVVSAEKKHPTQNIQPQNLPNY